MFPFKPKYWAFISYSHQDEKWAKWLHKSLEAYRIPRRLKTGIKRLFPVFLDREELPASSSLNTKLLEALEQSGYLIVVCSPYSAKSRWVNEEVLAFKRLGRSDRILAVIVDGEPNVTEDTSEEHECFPEALRFELESDGTLGKRRLDPLAADLRQGKDEKLRGLLKLVAAMIGVGFDNLYRRDRKRRLKWMFAAALFISLTVTGSTWYWLNFVGETTDYFAGTKRIWGEYVGVFPVGPESIKQRDIIIRTTRRGRRQGKLDRIEKINSSGELTNSLSGSANLAIFLPMINPGDILQQSIARIDFARDAAGDLVAEVGYNAENSKIYTLNYPPQNHEDNNFTATFITESGAAASRGESRVAQIKFVRATLGRLAGLDEAVKYADAYGEPKPDNLGIYGQLFEFDKQQLLRKVVFVGAEGQPIHPKGSNFSTMILKYNREGLQTGIEMIDESPQAAAVVGAGNGGLETYYDKFGNARKMVHKMMVNGVPAETEMIMQNGVMREAVTTIFNPSGKVVSREFFNEKMQIGISDEGVSSISAIYDPDGKLSQVTVMRRSIDPQSASDLEKTTGKSLPLPSDIKIPKMELIPCVVLDEVIAGGIAEKAGLKEGDRIIRYGGKDTPNSETLDHLTDNTDGPRELELVVVRGIDILKIRVSAGLLGVKVHNN